MDDEVTVKPGRYEIVFNVPIIVHVVNNYEADIEKLLQSALNKVETRVNNCTGLKIDKDFNKWRDEGKIFAVEGVV